MLFRFFHDTSLIPLVLIASISDCRSGERLTDPPKQQQNEAAGSEKSPGFHAVGRPRIRLGHSWDADPAIIHPVGTRTEPHRRAAATETPATVPPEQPSYLVPPTPAMLKIADSPAHRLTVSPLTPPAPVAEQHEPRQTPAINDAPAAITPTPPDLAAPFSLRGLYDRLRFRSARAKLQATDPEGQTPLAGEMGVAAGERSAAAVDPVALGAPEIEPASAHPRISNLAPAVMQACPSCFQCPMWAESPVPPALIPQ